MEIPTFSVSELLECAVKAKAAIETDRFGKPWVVIGEFMTACTPDRIIELCNIGRLPLEVTEQGAKMPVAWRIFRAGEFTRFTESETVAKYWANRDSYTVTPLYSRPHKTTSGR